MYLESEKTVLDSHPLRGKKAVLSTKHKKTSLIAPAMESAVGLLVHEVEIDTDVLGTFAGEVDRTDGPLETALQKARLGLAVTGEKLGLASEGSISGDSMLPVMVDEEIVVFVNLEDNYEVWESIRSYDIIARSVCVTGADDLDAFLVSADFPNHGLIVRPADGSHFLVHKGIHDFDTLKSVVSDVSKASSDTRVVIETDLRAHHCPSRRENIQVAASKLASRLLALCPTCSTPGWGVVRVNRGLLCRWCATETKLVREQVFGCVACESEQAQWAAFSDAADPQWCERCNP